MNHLNSPLGRYFYSKLPIIVRNDIDYQIAQRSKRAGANFDNLRTFTDECMKAALKAAPRIEAKFAFSDYKTNADTTRFNHHLLMCDNALERKCEQLTACFVGIIKEVGTGIDETNYIGRLTAAYSMISAKLLEVYITTPVVSLKLSGEALEREYEIALRRCLDVKWLMRRFLFLRAQYVEFAQIALGRVGKKTNQRKYISALSFSMWKAKQREAQRFIESQVVENIETGEAFDLSEVIKRTTANPENRRIEMMVRSRGNEERAIDLAYEGVFITWTLPSKYHPSSHKWNGSTIKEGHTALMNKWAIARAHLAKAEIDYFGFRVAEPHKDGCSHAHLFLFCAPDKKQQLVNILQSVAIEEDRTELGNDITPRFTAKFADPAKGGATAYIAKYISKNINGNHMPENEAQESAYAARAWASTHRIRQFQAFGSPAVGIWRQLRRATALQTVFCEKLDALRNAADTSKWNLFCQLAGDAALEYEQSLDKYGAVARKIIGFSWLGSLIETCHAKYRLVKKESYNARKKRGAHSWSTENNCNSPPKKTNSPLAQALIHLTGWDFKRIKHMIRPLMLGNKVQIYHNSREWVQFNNNRLITGGHL